MSMATPQVPTRPSRVHSQTSNSGSSLSCAVPKVPPRPSNKALDRSTSPHRERFAPSPLNETPFSSSYSNKSRTSTTAGDCENASAYEIHRPDSVSLPSIGQEGIEYADAYINQEEELATSPAQTRNIAIDLKLHAPKPSLPTSSAEQRVSTVTRTDSSQAAAYGLGKADSNDGNDSNSRGLKSKPSFTSQNSSGTEHRPSSVESEQGIPQIGQIVPMYPNAGDVQAPSPAPFSVVSAPGVGSHSDGTKSKHHSRRLSARAHEIPADAYGRYGHGIVPQDRFEKAYYEKHPELFRKELGSYGEARPEWALSSDDLNKIVRETASRGVGHGFSQKSFGTPSEQIGFQASEEYASRISSPRLDLHVAHSNASEIHLESHLRRELSMDKSGSDKSEKDLCNLSSRSEFATEKEAVENVIIHVDEPEKSSNKNFGAVGNVELTEDNQADVEKNIFHDERGYNAPILASDEVAKEPFPYELQPAVSPVGEWGNSYFEGPIYNQKNGGQTSISGRRVSSRSEDFHVGIFGIQKPESAPLEDLDEYEPLFPEDEKRAADVRKPLTTANRLKTEIQKRRFPSQDIWEDTPSSLQYTATVSTPQFPEEEAREPERKADLGGETPAQAFARRQEELAEKESKDSQIFGHQEKARAARANQEHLASEMRPNILAPQRFPSRDIWEDTPDSLLLETTVAGPQAIDEQEVTKVIEEQLAPATTEFVSPAKPSIPFRPQKLRLSESSEKKPRSIPEPSVTIGQSSTVERSIIPVKAKPQIPARPSKPTTRGSSGDIPNAKLVSDPVKSMGSDPDFIVVAKTKPAIPSRAVGTKIAALQGGFMSDLNKRLQLGPQALKKDKPAPEQAEEKKRKAPLSDARKGRARGPARKVPARTLTPTAFATQESVKGICALEFAITTTLWAISPEGDLHVSSQVEHKGNAPPAFMETAASGAPPLDPNTTRYSSDDCSGKAPSESVNNSSPSEVDAHIVKTSNIPDPVTQLFGCAQPSIISCIGSSIEEKITERIEPRAENMKDAQ